MRSRDLQDAQAFLRWVEGANETDAPTASAPAPTASAPAPTASTPAPTAGATLSIEQRDEPVATVDFPPINDIDLRWILRDIRARRFQLMKQSQDELRHLIHLGFVDVRDDGPELTTAGLEKIDGY